MGDSAYTRGVTVSADGVTVHQLYTEDEFEVPAVILKLLSHRSERTRVRVTVPNIDAERIGFHPEFGQQFWTLDDTRLTFEAELGPESALTTLYVIEAADEALVERALETLQIAAVTPLGDAEEHAVGPSATASESVDAERVDSLAENGFESIDESGPAMAEGGDGLDTETAEFGDEPDDILLDPEELEEGVRFESPSTGDPHGSVSETGPSSTDQNTKREDMDEGEPSETTAGEDSATPGTGAESAADTSGEARETAGTEAETASTPLSTDDLVTELLDRIDGGELSDEHHQQLATALGAETRDDVYDAKISQLQSRMSDVETFSTSVEEAVERHGPPAVVFDEFQERFDQLEAELDEVHERAETASGRIDAVEPRVDGVEETADSVEDGFVAVREEVEEIAEAVDDVETDISELQSWRKKVTGALKTFMGE